LSVHKNSVNCGLKPTVLLVQVFNMYVSKHKWTTNEWGFVHW